MKVVGIGGTLRENSTSRGALRRSLAAAKDAGAEVELLDLNQLGLSMYEPGKQLDEEGDVTDEDYGRRLDKLGGLVEYLAHKIGAYEPVGAEA